jgi:hypothetical protein
MFRRFFLRRRVVAVGAAPRIRRRRIRRMRRRF